MKIVVDTNILFSFFWEKSLTKKLLLVSKFELIAPKIAIEEIKKYSNEIIKKTGNENFKNDMNYLKKIVKFIDKKEYSEFIKESNEISPDKADAEFFALCLKHSCFLWSNDVALKKQDKVKVLSTKEVIEIFL